MRSLTIALAVLISLAAGLAAWGEDCSHARVNTTANAIFVTPGEVEELLWNCYSADQIAEFEWCQSTPLFGTLVGDWVICGAADWHLDDPWEVGFSGQFWMNPGLFDTQRGIVCTMEHSVVSWDIFVADRFMAIALEDISGGTGDYEGATGWLAFGPLSDRSRGNYTLEGWICTP